MFKTIRSGIWLILLISLLPLAGSPAGAQGLIRKGALKPEDVYNPKPAPGDIILPMPCGLQMVLRPASIPAAGLLADFETRLGSAEEREAGYYDRQYVGFVGSPLTLNDLPPAWREAVKKAVGPRPGQLYFLGKYEVSRAQWAAVMDADCPQPQGLAAAPQVDVSWYDVQRFNQMYMDWLLDQAPDSLPRFAGDDKNVGFLRLPTEAEWEYAARGGHAVSSDSLRSLPLFPLADGATASDYAVYRAEGGLAEKEAQRIGSKEPNPLGLYDTAGNVAEMTADAFRMTLGGRLHGAAGGFVRKGGSFMTGYAEILPGRREESAYYLKDGPAKARDLGFRLALSGVNTPGGDHLQQLTAEWLKLGENPVLPQNMAGDPLKEIDKLIAKAQTEDEKKIFEALRSLLKDNNIALERHNANMARTHLRGAVHAVYSLRNMDQRRKMTQVQIKLMEIDLQTATGQTAVQIKAAKDRMSALLPDIDKALEQQFAYYKALLEDVRVFDSQLLAQQMVFVEQDVKGDSFYAREMRKCLGKFKEQLELTSNGQTRKITLESTLNAGQS